MAIPDYQTLMLPVLQACSAAACSVPELVPSLSDAFRLTEEERAAKLPSGRQGVMHNRIHWAKFYLSKAGLVVTPTRGRFIATDMGRTLLASSPKRIDNSVLRRYPAFVTFVSASQAEAGPTSDEGLVGTAASISPATPVMSPREQLEASDVALRSSVRSDLLDRLLTESPTFFEQVVVDLLVAMGYGGTHADAAQRIGKSGDGGVDGVIDEDRLGLDRIYIQAKRYTDHAVTPNELPAFVGTLEQHGATKGVFVTTATFTKQAIVETGRISSKRIKLIDGDLLAQLMIEHKVGVRVDREVTIYAIDENYFADDD